MECSLAVGTSNKLKFWATVRAFTNYCTVTRKTMVNVRRLKPQPIGLREIIKGAIVRAVEALEKAETDYGVGVEAGPLIVANIGLELQVAAIIDSNGGTSIGFSQAFMIPNKWLTEMMSGVELGAIAERETSRKGIGSTYGIVSYLSMGRVSRGDLTYEAVTAALIPRMNVDIYGRLPHYTEVLEMLEKS